MPAKDAISPASSDDGQPPAPGDDNPVKLGSNDGPIQRERRSANAIHQSNGEKANGAAAIFLIPCSNRCSQGICAAGIPIAHWR